MNLKDREGHFEFGANWREYAKTIDKNRIDLATAGLKKLFPEGIAGKSFLDIGCGSGLHALAALSLGASSVLAIDIDENSVGTTREVLKKYAPDKKWDAKITSVFDTSPDALGTFDVVYSWGVLHHTGNMWHAIEKAAALVGTGGQFSLAIYAKTPFDFASATIFAGERHGWRELPLRQPWPTASQQLPPRPQPSRSVPQTLRSIRPLTACTKTRPATRPS